MGENGKSLHMKIFWQCGGRGSIYRDHL